MGTKLLSWVRSPGRLLILTGAGITLLVVLAAWFGPLLAPHDPARQYAEGLGPGGVPLPPGPRFWLGTDSLGRDTLSRLLYGTRPSLEIGVGAAVLALAVGVILGLFAGYTGGWIGSMVMRLTDVFMAFPTILLLVALAAVIRERTVPTLVLVIGAVGWTLTARVVRAETLALRERLYVQAARALGAGHWRIVCRHVLPHLVPLVAVIGSLSVAATLLLDAGLSFLGLGLPVGQPTWGQMMRDAQSFYRTAPWTVIWPGLAVVIAVTGFNLLAWGGRRACG